MPEHTAVGWNNTGAENPLTAASVGDQLVNRPGMFVQYRNASGVQRTITFKAAGICSYGVLHDVSFTIADGGDALYGYFPTSRFGRLIDVEYDDPSGLSLVAAYFPGLDGLGARLPGTSLVPIVNQQQLQPQPWRGDGSSVSFVPASEDDHYFVTGEDLFLILDGRSAALNFSPTFEPGSRLIHGFALRTASLEADAGQLRRKGGFPREDRWGNRVIVGVANHELWQVALARFDDMNGIGDDPTSPPALGASPGMVPVVSEPPAAGDYIDAPIDGCYLNVGRRVRMLVQNTGSEDRRLWLHSPTCSHGFRDDISILVPGETFFQTLEIAADRVGSLVPITYDDPNVPGVLDATNLRFVGFSERSYR